MTREQRGTTTRGTTRAWSASFLPLVLSSLLGACAGSPPAPQAPPSQPDAPDDASGSTDETSERPRADVLLARPDAVPPPPASCGAAPSIPPPRTCAEPLPAFEAAFAVQGAARDAQLAELEGCAELPRGFVRALRAELAPPGCADGFVEPYFETDDDSFRGPWREVLVGLALGARLERLAVSPPAPPASREKAALEAYFAETLFPWVNEQASAIYAMAAQGAGLSGYAQGLVAIEAGMADMRFVEIARAVPIPLEMESDAELRDVYYASLDEALESRKARGRDAALVGLRQFAALGVHHDARLARARELLSRVFGGSRVTALDALLVPPPRTTIAGDPKTKLLAGLPTPYAALLFSPVEPTIPLVQASLTRGLPVPWARALESSTDPSLRLWAARARFQSGRLYFRRDDFQAADRLLASVLDATPSESGATKSPLAPGELDDARFFRALAIALSAGPEDAARLFVQGPRFADALGNLALLDAFAEGAGPHAGRAAFDGAYLRELIAEPGDPDAWKELARRYESAAARLSGAERTQAQERRLAALATEKALRGERR